MDGSRLRLVPITAENVKNVWPFVEPLIKAACRRGVDDCDPESFRQACETAKHQLWVVFGKDGIQACLTTGIWNCSDGRKVCELGAFAGKWDDKFSEFLAQIEHWAKDQGCYGMRSYSRVGMKKLMPQEYKIRGYALERKF